MDGMQLYLLILLCYANGRSFYVVVNKPEALPPGQEPRTKPQNVALWQGHCYIATQSGIDLRLVCQMQEQQMQAHTQQTPAILDMAAQVEDRANLRELLRRTAISLTSGRDTAGAPTPAPEATDHLPAEDDTGG